MTAPHRLVTLLFVLTSMGGLMPGCSRKAPLEVVASVDLHRYQGLWYEIARYPHRFEKDCVGATAFYTLRDDCTVFSS